MSLIKKTLGFKVRIIPRSRGIKGVNWERYYQIQFKVFPFFWWDIGEAETIEDAKNIVFGDLWSSCKPNVITYTFKE